MRTGTCHKSSFDNRALRRSALLGLLLGCLTSFVACPVPFVQPTSSSSGIPSGTSTLTLSVGPQASRAIVAGSTDYFGAIQAYKVTVSKTGNTYTSTTVSAGVCTITDIVAGSYTITVQAYSDVGSTTEIAQGTTTATLYAAATTSASVTLSFTQSASSGGFSLPIQWPLSTGFAYIYATLDGTAIAVPTVTIGATYSATLSASALSGGAHVLGIFFKTSSAATTVFGPYLESLNIWDGVTDRMWADPSGNLLSTLSFGSDDFVSPDATLAGLSFSGGPTLATAFNPTTYGYNFTGGSLTAGISYPFTISAQAANQGVSCTFNDVACPLTASSPTTLTGSFTAVSGNNTLKITVTATDRKSTQTYVVTTAVLVTGATPAETGTNLVNMLNSDLTGNFVLGADAEIANMVIGGSTHFTGFFDGAGHTVTLTNNTGGGWSGLFCTIGMGGVVKNVHVNCVISGADFTGAIAALNEGMIEGCSSSGTITCTSGAVGGLVGQNGIFGNSGTIIGCYSTANVTGMDSVGGLVGAQGEGAGYGSIVSYIFDSYAQGAVTATSGSAGGLVGYQRLFGNIERCYATGPVTGTPSGGLVGGCDVGAIVVSSFYDQATTGQSDTGKGTGLATADMLLKSTYTGWDFINTWSITTSYPFLLGY